MSRRIITIVAFCIAAVLAATWAFAAVSTPAVTVANQPIVGDTVTIGKVDATEPSWMVIHADDKGNPGPVIGYAHVEAGETRDLKVKVEAGKATPALFAMLHLDKGKPGVYEFPGPDVPAMVKGAMVNPSFKIVAKAADDPLVSIRSFAFHPRSISVPSGSTVTWVNEDTAPHTVTADDGSFDSGNLEKGGKFSRTFPMAGTFNYYCANHGSKGGGGMAGTVVVTP